MDALTSVPLFPLAGHVLLPGLPVPFHVFEPRYRALVRDLLELPPAERWLAVPRIQPGHETEAASRPPICDVVSAARLAAATPLPDGRFLIAVVGDGRWRLRERLSPHPYRIADLERMLETEPEADMPAKVAGAVRRHLGSSPAVAEDILALLDPERHPAVAVLDRLAGLTLVDPDLRQRYLETASPCCRLRVLEGAESRCGPMAAPVLN